MAGPLDYVRSVVNCTLILFFFSSFLTLENQILVILSFFFFSVFDDKMRKSEKTFLLFFYFIFLKGKECIRCWRHLDSRFEIFFLFYCSFLWIREMKSFLFFFFIRFLEWQKKKKKKCENTKDGISKIILSYI